MSRLASLLIVLLAIAVATPVLAEDRLSLNGEMRVRGWHVDVDGDDNTETWADQRLRIGGKFSVAEGVSATFRFDATEANWGSGGVLGAGRIPDGGTMQWDMAYMDLEKGMFHLRGGQHYVGLGTAAFDSLDTGFLLNIKAPVSVSLFTQLEDDNGSRDAADGFYYGANVNHKTDMYAANVFMAASSNTNTDITVFEAGDNNASLALTDQEAYLIGVNYAQNFDAFKLFAEVNYFFGDVMAGNITDQDDVVLASINEEVDIYGLQGYVDLSTAITETVTLGGQFFYAMGDDDDVQYTFIGDDFGGWDPIFTLGTGLHNEQIDVPGRPYDMLGNGAGLFAGRFYANMKANDDLSFSASAFYGVDDEEDRALYEDVMAFGAGMSYAVMSNTKLGVQLQYSDYSSNVTGMDDLEKFEVGTGLFVNF